MRRIYIAMCCLWAGISGVCAQDNTNKVRITLRQAIQIAQLQSVDAAVALNELRTAYWEFRTHRADQLPEVIFTGTLLHIASNTRSTSNRMVLIPMCKTMP